MPEMTFADAADMLPEPPRAHLVLPPPTQMRACAAAYGMPARCRMMFYGELFTQQERRPALRRGKKCHAE